MKSHKGSEGMSECSCLYGRMHEVQVGSRHSHSSLHHPSLLQVCVLVSTAWLLLSPRDAGHQAIHHSTAWQLLGLHTCENPRTGEQAVPLQPSEVDL